MASLHQAGSFKIFPVTLHNFSKHLDLELHHSCITQLFSSKLCNVFSKKRTGKRHPWTNTSVGETLEELSGPLVHTNLSRKRYGPMIGPYLFPPELV